MRHSQAVGLAERIAVLVEAKIEREYDVTDTYLRKTIPEKPEQCPDCSPVLKDIPKSRVIRVYFHHVAGLPGAAVSVHLHQSTHDDNVWVVTSVVCTRIAHVREFGKAGRVEEQTETWAGQELYDAFFPQTQPRGGNNVPEKYHSPHIGIVSS